MGKALSEKHHLPNREDRVVKPYFLPAYGKSMTAPGEEFERVERLLDEMVVDYINGKTRSDIFQKAKEGMYENQKKPMSKTTFNNYWLAVVSRLKYDRPDDIEHLKDFFYNALLNIYNEAIDANNLKDARDTISTMIKLTGVADAQQKVSIEKKDNGDINITFGFSSNNEN